MGMGGTGRTVIRMASRRRKGRALLVKTDVEVAARVDLVAASEGVPADRLLDPERGDSVSAAARHLAMYLAHVMLRRPLPHIGRLFSRDRTTVSHACALIEDRRDEPAFDAHVCCLEETILGWQDAGLAGKGGDRVAG